MSTLEHHNELDDQQYQACYIFKPKSQMPAKRRKTHHDQSTSSSKAIFAPLLNGHETTDQLDLRFKTYQELWSQQEARINEILEKSNSSVLGRVTTFVNTSSSASGIIPIGYITTGPSISSHGLLLSQLTTRLLSEPKHACVILTAAEAPNFKALLKLLIRRVTDQGDSSHEDDGIQIQRGRKLLDYDLEILHAHVRRLGLEKVVVAFQDGEAFDGIMLAELISLMSSWLDRIPFVLLFGVATSVGHFQAKLSRSALKHMCGDQFDVEKVDTTLQQVLRQIFRASKSLKLGPGLVWAMLDRHRDHVQSIQSFATGVKYAYMSHFFANPLSMLLAEEGAGVDLPPEFYETVRHLGSFRRLVEDVMDAGNVETAMSLLEDDAFLKMEISQGLSCCADASTRLLDAVEVLHTISANLSKRQSISFSDLYLKAVSGELYDSALMRDLLLSMIKMQTNDFTSMLEEITSLQLQDPSLADKLREAKHNVELEQTKSTQQHHGQEQTPRRTGRTRIVSQKAESTGTTSVAPRQEPTSLQPMRSVQETLKTYFKENLLFPKSLFLHEVFFFDFKSPYREVFSPKSRFAIERSLLQPRDYLACDCCGPSVGGLSATQPATAILYQLYLESGALINVFDLWSAFYTIIGGEDGEDCDSVNALALFYRGLADLKYMGMIKHSRKRTDHIAKLAWKGL